MKVAIDIRFSNEKIQLDNGYHFIEWNYPVLPRTGEFVCVPSQFLSDKMREFFKKTTVFSVFPELFEIPEYGSPFENDKEKTLFDWYSEDNSDRFYVGDIEWNYDEENGHFPIINISEYEVYNQ